MRFLPQKHFYGLYRDNVSSCGHSWVILYFDVMCHVGTFFFFVCVYAGPIERTSCLHSRVMLYCVVICRVGMFFFVCVQGPLRERIEALAGSLRFPLKKLYVMVRHLPGAAHGE